MKYRESGMPVEDIWDKFFDPEKILSSLEVDEKIRLLVDIGCGFGTFLLPAAKRINGLAIGIDIDEKMIDACKNKAEQLNLSNVKVINENISAKASTVLLNYKAKVDYVTLFNILHCEKPHELLKTTHELLADNGKVGIIHWIHEDTPRGPSLKYKTKT